jgi:hypothetical protein
MCDRMVFCVRVSVCDREKESVPVCNWEWEGKCVSVEEDIMCSYSVLAHFLFFILRWIPLQHARRERKNVSGKWEREREWVWKKEREREREKKSVCERERALQFAAPFTFSKLFSEEILDCVKNNRKRTFIRWPKLREK